MPRKLLLFVAGTEEHPSNPHHIKLFLDTGENIGVINKEEPERLLPKIAGGTPAVDNVDVATSFRMLGKNSYSLNM